VNIPIRALLLTLLLLPSTLVAQQSAPAAADFHSEIRSLYDFHPPALTAAQRNEKSAAMDKLWAAAKAQPDAYIPRLRQELADATNPSFFFFDGSQLLASLSHDPADQKLVSAALARVDLQDPAPAAYFYFVHDLAVQKNDTTAAAFNILSDPKFQVNVPQHALLLAQNYCLIYMLLPTDQNFWLQPAIDRLHREKDPTAQESLLLLIWYAQTAASDQAIAEFSRDSAQSQTATAYAKSLIERKPNGSAPSEPVAQPATERALREARAARMKAVSDEALEDLDAYTSQIMAARGEGAH
jgi:hypothetical protein